MSTKLSTLLTAAMVLFAAASSGASLAQTAVDGEGLEGAWQGKVQFTTGPFAETKDLEFMYAFAAGGVMMESSNYDAAPPVPPAYGVWKKVGPRKYKAAAGPQAGMGC